MQAAGSHCGGFTCGARALGAQASAAVACGLYCKGSVVVAHRLSDPMTCGIFPDQGWNPCALAGGFLSTVVPGKSVITFDVITEN